MNTEAEDLKKQNEKLKMALGSSTRLIRAIINATKIDATNISESFGGVTLSLDHVLRHFEEMAK